MWGLERDGVVERVVFKVKGVFMVFVFLFWFGLGFWLWFFFFL